MREETRIVYEYGTVSGFTGKWLVQHRFGGDGEWTTCFTAWSKAEAQAYIDDMPDWVKGDNDD